MPLSCWLFNLTENQKRNSFSKDHILEHDEPDMLDCATVFFHEILEYSTEAKDITPTDMRSLRPLQVPRAWAASQPLGSQSVHKFGSENGISISNSFTFFLAIYSFVQRK